MTITASTKRNPAASGGKIGAPATNLASLDLAYAPLPLSPDLVEKYRLNSARKNYKTGAFGNPDVKDGDQLTTGGVTYIVRGSDKVTGPVAFLNLILEEVIA